MANKRDLKKQIKYVCGELALECIMTREYVEGADIKLLNDLVLRAAELQTNSLKNATFSFDKTPSDFESRAVYNRAAEQYFKNAYAHFYKLFNTHVKEIVSELNKATPAAQRELNKKIANQ